MSFTIPNDRLGRVRTPTNAKGGWNRRNRNCGEPAATDRRGAITEQRARSNRTAKRRSAMQVAAQLLEEAVKTIDVGRGS
jgi:hypothetical protein